MGDEYLAFILVIQSLEKSRSTLYSSPLTSLTIIHRRHCIQFHQNNWPLKLIKSKYSNLVFRLFFNFSIWMKKERSKLGNWSIINKVALSLDSTREKIVFGSNLCNEWFSPLVFSTSNRLCGYALLRENDKHEIPITRRNKQKSRDKGSPLENHYLSLEVIF